jgi:hypothetical protein
LGASCVNPIIMAHSTRPLLWLVLASTLVVLLGGCYVESGPAYGPPRGRAYVYHDYYRR